jgi:hypothetical protein
VPGARKAALEFGWEPDGSGKLWDNKEAENQTIPIEHVMLETLLTGFIGGICAWFFTDFGARPFRGFYDLRSEVGRCLVYYTDVTARGRWVNAYQIETNDITPDEYARLTAAQNAYRHLGAKMGAFADGERLANWMVRATGFDAGKIARALIVYSNEIETYGQRRAGARNNLEKLLRPALFRALQG